MLRTLCCFFGLLATAFLNSMDALTADRATNRARPNNRMTMLKDDGFKPKIITPNDIASLFGDSNKNSNSKALDGYSEDDDDDDDDFDFDQTEEETTTAVADISMTQIVDKVDKVETRKYDSESNAMRELLALQKEMMAPSVPVDIVTEILVDEVETSYEVEDESDDVDDYLNFDKVLDKATRKRVMDTMTMTESRFASGAKAIPRVFKYDPTDNSRGDPMQYGAYRRWKLAEDSNLDSKGKPKKKKSKSSTGYQAGDYKVDGANGGEAIGSRDVGGKKKKSKGGSLNADSFYDAIKKFGSGAKDGATGGTGTAEPPSNKNPIQPKKALAKKNRKKVITPDDINSLFAEKKLADEEDDENEEDEADQNALTASDSSSGAFTNSFNPMMGANEETPQWILDANKEASKKKKMKGKKKKALTDDWRFWAAIITGAGFASAFFNIYQQTGGFGSGSKGEFGDGQELVI